MAAIADRDSGPAWHDQVSAVLPEFCVNVRHARSTEVKLAAAGTGNAFALASEGWARPLPDGLVWNRLVGDPLIRRTWAAWHNESRRKDLARLVAELDLSNESR